MNSKTRSILQIFKNNVCTLFNLLNLLIALALGIVGAWKNTLFIGIIVINTVIGIIQELKARKEVEALSLITVPTVTVARDNSEQVIKPEEIRLGDIMTLTGGCVVCADCTVCDGEIEVNESILTGESEPVFRRANEKLLSGSMVISGKCTARADCEFDKSFTAKMTNEVKTLKPKGSQLLKAINKVSRFTCCFIIPIGLLMMVQALFFRKIPFVPAVVSTSAGLLGMLPKGLVLLISISLAAGVIKLSKRRVLIRDLYSLENLAHCDVVCMDKTGTLTEGLLSVKSVHPLIDEDEFKNFVATYVRNTYDNNSTFEALKSYFGSTCGYKATPGMPFSSQRKYSSVNLGDGRVLLVGTPEMIFGKIPAHAECEMNLGNRVICVGICTDSVHFSDIRALGTIVISDKIRSSAASTISYFRSQGVCVKIISGDNPQTVAAVASAAGVDDAGNFIDMTNVTDDEVASIANEYTIFGRVSPEQKKMLISSMQAEKHSVAMIGDGVNDLLAMHQADCSIAMGNGSDAAKQTSQLVMIDSDFSVLSDVINEGRRVVNTVTKSAGVFFIKTIYSLLLCLYCIAFNVEFPFIPLQITLIDVLVEALPAFILSFEKRYEKIEGTFLNSALRMALPNGFAIFSCCAVLLFSLHHLWLSYPQSLLAMYAVVGYVSIYGVIKSCSKIDIVHFLIIFGAALMFTIVTFFFPDLIQLPSLTREGAYILAASLTVALSISSIKFNFGIRPLFANRKKLPL